MCRNIRTLFNFSPTATDEEVRAASLQFVRKVCGFTKPSHANQAAFDRAVDEVARAARTLLDGLTSTAIGAGVTRAGPRGNPHKTRGAASLRTPPPRREVVPRAS